jgi:putative ABC transport system permease protein
MRALRHALYLAWRSLSAGPGRAAVVALGVAVALFLPVFTLTVGATAEDRLLARARSTPIVLGRPGDEFDLVMAALYFRGQVREPLPWSSVALVRERAYGQAVPLYLAHSAGGAPVVGTSLSYFEARGLAVRDGRLPAVLGEVVAGAGVAADFGLSPGDTVRSDLKNLYNLAGAYPLLLEVVGVLAPTGGPDDDAFFADVKTLWAIDGLIHGHAQVAGEGEVEADPGIFTFDRITPETRAGFHLHGDDGDWPVSAILVFPGDRRAHDELLGDAALEEDIQATRPEAVVQAILEMVLRLKALLSSWVGLVGASTAGFIGLTISLSLRLRQAEVVLLRRLGGSRWTVARILGAELAIVLLLGVAGAIGLTVAADAALARLF